MDVPVAITLSQYTTLAKELQACCRHMTGVKGAQKLERRIGTEIKFFESLSNKDEATQAAQLQSSNLSHFAAIVHAATHLPGVTRLMKPFASPGRRQSLEVDVVAHQGRSWFKVVARKGQALHLIWAGQGQFGERDMVQQLREYQQCAQHHPVHFSTPQVQAAFYNTLTQPMAATLQEMGVQVWGKVVPVHTDISRMLTAHLAHDRLGEEESEEEEEEEVSDGSRENVVGLVRDDDDDDDDDDLVCDGEVESRAPLASNTTSPKPVSNAEVTKRDLACDGQMDDDLACDGETVDDRNQRESARNTSLAELLPALKVRPQLKESPRDVSPFNRSSGANYFDSSSPTTTAGEPHNDRSIQPSSKTGSSSPSSSPSPSPPSSSSSPDQLTSSDLETDCAPEIEVKRVCPSPPQGKRTPSEEEHADETASFVSAWKLSPRSQESVRRILLACPDWIQEDGRGGGEREVGGRRGVREVVNLDITTLITLVSAVCHGQCHFRFRDKVLDQQASEERQEPTLPALSAFLQDKDWIACRTAWDDFNSIVQLLGGPSERKRAAELLNRLRIVDDNPSERASNLKLRGKVKDRSKMVFGTGDQMQAVTITANSGFIRAAESQNVSFAVHMHPARALTEQKESTASPL